MEYTLWDKSMKLDKIQLNYEAHMVGYGGEKYCYSIYFENDATDENCNEVDNAVDKACEEFGEGYLGYIDINIKDNMVTIYHDMIDVEDCYSAIKIILKSLNNVTGVKNVVINEGCEDCDD